MFNLPNETEQRETQYKREERKQIYAWKRNRNSKNDMEKRELRWEEKQGDALMGVWVEASGWTQMQLNSINFVW